MRNKIKFIKHPHSNPWISNYFHIMVLAVPVLFAHLAESLIPFINTAIAASLSEAALAAVGLAGAVFFICIDFCWGVISVIGIMTAKKLGGGFGQDKIGLTFSSGLLASVILSIPCMFLFANAQTIWLYFGQDPNVSNLGQNFLNGLMFAIPPDLAKFAVFQFAMACEKPKMLFIANLLSLPLLVACNFVLTHGYFGLPQLGIYGIGLGTAITYWIVLIGMLIYLATHQPFKNYLLQKQPIKNYLFMFFKQMIRGAPIGLMFSVESSFFFIMSLLMGKISTIVLAANQIAIQWMWIATMMVYGFSEPTAILVGKAYSAKNFYKVEYLTIVGIILVSTAMITLFVIYLTAPQFIIGIDTFLNRSDNNTKLFEAALPLLLACGVYQIFDSIRSALSGTLRSIGHTAYPLWSMLITYIVIALPIGYLGAFKFKWQGLGLWYGFILAAIVNTILEYLYFRYVLIKAKRESVKA